MIGIIALYLKNPSLRICTMTIAGSSKKRCVGFQTTPSRVKPPQLYATHSSYAASRLARTKNKINHTSLQPGKVHQKTAIGHLIGLMTGKVCSLVGRPHCEYSALISDKEIKFMYLDSSESLCLAEVLHRSRDRKLSSFAA